MPVKLPANTKAEIRKELEKLVRKYGFPVMRTMMNRYLEGMRVRARLAKQKKELQKELQKINERLR
ncbi:MAG: hypothetical protein ACE5JS_20480 [Nitrospinota bacterium]